MEKTYYSRNPILFLGWKNITNLTGCRPKNRREEMQGIQFREGKFTTSNERLIKALDKYIQYKNDILDYDFTKSDIEQEVIIKNDRKRQELFKPEQSDKSKILKSIRALL